VRTFEDDAQRGHTTWDLALLV